MAGSRINIAMVARIIGWLLLMEAAFLCVPALTGFLSDDPESARAFALTALFTGAVGGICTRFIRPRRTDMGKREGFLLTSLVWVVFSLFGMIPFMLAPTARLTISEAFFEAMSGFTTTGATLVADVDGLSNALNVWHCLCQWIGGLGIIIFTLAVIPMFNSSGGIQMFSAESTGVTVDKIRPRISSTAKEMWGIYTGLTILLFLLLWAGPMDSFQAACHAMATMSTGGFSTSAQGVNEWSSAYVKIVMTLFMFLGGVNFALIFRALHRQFRYVVANDTIKTFLKIIVGATLFMALCALLTQGYKGWQSVTIDPLFQVVSCVTSTGYTLEGFFGWGPSAMAVALILMFTGGCAGSTSGGAKIDRLVYLKKYLSTQIRMILRPNSVCSVIVNHKVIPATTVGKVVAFICIYVAVMVVGGVALTTLGVPLSRAFYASFACISNAGLETLTHSFSAIPQAGLWVLSAVMLIGRLEIFTVIILFTRSFWHR